MDIKNIYKKPKALNINVTNMLHMEQKIYKYEVILNLIRDNNHLRKIAKELNTNHMTIKRVLDSLVKENVLDVKKQGRNNIFSIKRTLEAQSVVFSAELYNFSRFINRHIELKQDIMKLKSLPLNIIVIFGSYAKGNATNKSDIDIYAETEDNKIKRELEKINSKFSVKIGRYNKDSLLIKEIERDHIIVKGVEQFYEKNKFFG